MIEFIVPGLLTWSCEIADVSVTPGRACVNICHSMLVFGIPEPRSSDMREYWLPTRPLMFSHFGCAGSSGGLSGSNAIWHEPQVVPIRNGGSYEASASLLTRSSDGMPVVLIICLRKPSQLASAAAVELSPLLRVEARIRELAQAERARGRAELEIARGMALVDRSALGVRVAGVERRVLQPAGRIDIPVLADILEQHIVARAPVEADRSRRDSSQDNPDRPACSTRDR